MDPASILFGICISILILFLLREYFLWSEDVEEADIVDPTDDVEEFDQPRCPDCQSTNLVMSDYREGLPWLQKSDGKETDFYTCIRCGRQFSDEDWKTVKSTNVRPMGKID